MEEIILKDIVSSEGYEIDTVEKYFSLVEVVEKLQGVIKGYEDKIKKEAKIVFDSDDKLMKISKDGYTVTRFRRGDKVAIKPLDEMYEEGDPYIAISYKPDTKKLNDYMKKNDGQLPENWVMKISERIDVKFDKKSIE